MAEKDSTKRTSTSTQVEEKGPEAAEQPPAKDSTAAPQDEAVTAYNAALAETTPEPIEGEGKDDFPAVAAESTETGRKASRYRQHPALVGEPGVEVAERSQDTDAQSTTTHRKVFVTRKDDYTSTDTDQVHLRNMTAVRQYMVNQGIRPDASVRFIGAEDHFDGVSLNLVYEVSAVPAVTADDIETRHTVIPNDGPTAAERALHDAQREDRIRASHDALRA